MSHLITKAALKNVPLDAFLKTYVELPHKTPTQINEILTHCSQWKFPEKLQKLTALLWNDIAAINSSQHLSTTNSQQFHYGLILKHCVTTSSQCIQTLEWMQTFQSFNARDAKHYSMAISKIVPACCNEWELSRIFELVQAVGINDIYINMAMIGACQKLSNNEFRSKQILRVYQFAVQKDAKLIGAVMNALLRCHQYQHAMTVYQQSVTTLQLDDICHALAMEACIGLNDFATGKECHARVPDTYNLSVKNSLIQFYGHFGDVCMAENIFHSVPSHQLNAMFIGVMMQMYARNRAYAQALQIYDTYHMHHNSLIHAMAIDVYADSKQYENGVALHSKLSHHKQMVDARVCQSLISFYAKFDDIDTAKTVFECLRKENVNVLMVNAMMRAFWGAAQFDGIVAVYDAFRSRSGSKLVLNQQSLAMTLNACVKLNDAQKGKAIIDTIAIKHVHGTELWSSMMEFHGHFGKYTEALNLWNLSVDTSKNSFLLHTILEVCRRNCEFQKCFALYDAYPSLRDDNVYLSVLRACGECEDLTRAKQVCQNIDIYKASTRLTAALIEVLGGKFGCVDIARQIFQAVNDEDLNASIVGALMAAFMNNGQCSVAMDLYDRYNAFHCAYLHSLAVEICASLGEFEKGIAIGTAASKEDSVVIETALIRLHGAKGAIATAEQILEANENRMGIKGYNAMMTAYCDCKMYEECIQMFDAIFNGNKVVKERRLLPDIASYTIVLKACTACENYEYGQKVHQHLTNSRKQQRLLNRAPMQAVLTAFYAKMER